ncbi:hypothetical protein [Kaistia sp. 32K]|nr:hypothetical protein [Kaistia sp. 32K]
MSVTLLRTTETVAWEQPAALATSIMVTRFIVLPPLMLSPALLLYTT